MSDINDDIGQMSDQELEAALAAEVPSAVDDAKIQNDIEDYKKYGDDALRTFAESAASSATFGLSDQAQVKLGISTPEELRKRAEINPIASGTGQAAGIITPIVASGGTSLVAKGIQAAGKGVLAAESASVAAGKVAEKALASALKSTSNKKIAKEIVKKSIAKGVEGATEGAVYGAGQLVREDALGTADFNAENLLAYTGSGALLGGTLSSALPLAGAASTKLGAQIGKGTSKMFSKVADPVEDSAALLGFTKAQMEKIHSKNPKFFDGVPEYLKDRLQLKVLDNAESVMIKNNAIKKAAAKELDDIYEAVGDNVIGTSVVFNIAKKLEDDFIKPYEGMESFRSAIRPAKNIVKDLKLIASREGTLSAKELRSLRMKMDDLAQSYYKARDPSKGAEAAFGARSLIRDELNSFVKSVNPELGARLEKANKDFHYAETISKALDKKVLNDKNLLDFKDYALGGIFGGMLGNAGLLIPGAKKLLESDFKRRLVILSGIEKANKIVDSKILQSTKGFLKKAKRAAEPLSIVALMDSPLSYKDSEKPKTKQEAFTNIRNKVKEFRSEPEKFETNLAKSLYGVAKAAPETAQYMKNQSIAALEFLDDKLPKDVNEILGPSFMQKEFRPSSMEIAKFERYMQIIENPLSALDELESGTLTREHVEALEKVYPSLYVRLRSSIMDEIRNEPEMPYDKKIQLGILMNLETDISLMPENVLALQSNFAPQAQQESPTSGAVNSTQSGVSKLKLAERAKTDTQETLERE